MSLLPTATGHIFHDFGSLASLAPAPPPPLIPAQSRAISEAFLQHSADGATLTRHEFKCAYAQLFGTKPAKAHWQLLCKLQSDQDTREGAQAPGLAGELATVVSERLFRSSMQEAMQSSDPGEHVRQVFRAFDVRCAGYISRDDAHRVFSNAAPSVNGRVVDEMFDELDRDRDGRVSCSDFIQMMQLRIP